MAFDYYEEFKPIRNILRNLSIDETLKTIWAYSNYYTYDSFRFPPDITKLLCVSRSKSRYFHDWHLALLAREVIRYAGSDNVFSKYKLSKHQTQIKIFKMLVEFEDHAAADELVNSGINSELRRYMLNQFSWHELQSFSIFIKHYNIYNDETLKLILKNKIGLSLNQWFYIGMFFRALFMKNYKISAVISIPDFLKNTIRKVDVEVFLKSISVDYCDIKKKIDSIPFDDKFLYELNPLIQRPIIKYRGFYYCPIGRFLIERLTLGLYYDLVSGGRFGKAYGMSFQNNYLMELMKRVFVNNSDIKVIPESPYKVDRNQKDSIDFIVEQKNSALFIDAKACRHTLNSKTVLNPFEDKGYYSNLDKLAENIIKMYKTYVDFRAGCYSHYSYKGNMFFYPMIVILEDMLINYEYLAEKVVELSFESDLPKDIIDKSPYTICCSSKFELLIQLFTDYTIQEIMDKWFKEKSPNDDFGEFIVKNYSYDFKSLDFYFKDKIPDIFPVC